MDIESRGYVAINNNVTSGDVQIGNYSNDNDIYIASGDYINLEAAGTNGVSINAYSSSYTTIGNSAGNSSGHNDITANNWSVDGSGNATFGTGTFGSVNTDIINTEGDDLAISGVSSGGTAVQINGNGGNDIRGTSGNWLVDGSGNGTFNALTTTTNVTVGQNLIQQGEDVDVSGGTTTLDGLASIYDLSSAADSTAVTPPTTTTTQIIYVHNATGSTQTIAGADVANGKTATIVYFPTSGWKVTGVY